MTWQPIETAPKDGQAVLLYGGAGCHGWSPPDSMRMNPQSISFWSSVDMAWIEATGENYERHVDPTHWQPMLRPPE